MTMAPGGVGTEGLGGGSAVTKRQRVFAQKMVAAVFWPEVAIWNNVSMTLKLVSVSSILEIEND